MKKSLLNNKFLIVAIPALFSGMCNSANAQTVPTPDHVIILIEENYAYSQIIGSTLAPHINALTTDTNCAVFSQCYAIEHPSQPNYLAFFSGSDQGNHDDNIPVGIPFTTPNIASELLAASKTFITYSEDIPAAGFTGATSGLYVRKHNPITNWFGTGTNQVSSTLSQPFTAFPASTNYSSLPTVCYVIPNQVNDMHNGSIPAGDNWYFNKLDTLKQWCMANNSLLVITFDEDDDNHGNQIATLFYGPMVKNLPAPNYYTEHITLYNMLRTFEDMYGLTHAGAAATATPITDCWRTNIHNAGVNTTTNNSTLKCIPNPADNYVTFSMNTAPAEPVTISINDMTGRMVGTFSMNTAEFKVSTAQLTNGLYTYRINDSKNTLDHGKFVINHN